MPPFTVKQHHPFPGNRQFQQITVRRQKHPAWVEKKPDRRFSSFGRFDHEPGPLFKKAIRLLKHPGALLILLVNKFHLYLGKSLLPDTIKDCICLSCPQMQHGTRAESILLIIPQHINLHRHIPDFKLYFQCTLFYNICQKENEIPSRHCPMFYHMSLFHTV